MTSNDTDPWLQIAITGAESGLGASIAMLVAGRDAMLSIADKNPVGNGKTAQSLPRKDEHICVEVEVAQATSVAPGKSVLCQHLLLLSGLTPVCSSHATFRVKELIHDGREVSTHP
jgi:hypothetical protein